MIEKTKHVIYIPSFKKNIKTFHSDNFIISSFEVLFIDYLFENCQNINIKYLFFEHEEKNYVNNIKSVYSNHSSFSIEMFNLNNIVKDENSILITNLLKVGIFYTIYTLKKSIYYLPLLEQKQNIYDDLSINKLMYICDDIESVVKIINNSTNLKSRFLNFINGTIL